MRRRNILAAVLAAAFALAIAAFPATKAAKADGISPASTYTTAWQRIGGDTRYSTMELLARKGFSSSNTVLLATGEKFPDALSASAYAGMLGCPIVTTAPDSLSNEARETIRSLGAKNVCILGGTQAVSEEVADDVRSLGCTVTRLAGNDRFSTGVAIYNAGKSAGSWSKTCIIAKSGNFADALSIAPYAYASKSPIFLVDDGGSLTAEELSAIKSGGFAKAIALGGTGAYGVTDATMDSLGIQWLRLAGETRYETSADIVIWETGEDSSAAFQPDAALSYGGMAVATGERFPDALVSIDLLGPSRSALLLVSQNSPTRDNIDGLVHSHDAQIGNGYIIGGLGAVDVVVEGWLNGVYSTLKVHYISVGQGDSEFLELPNGETMLIDAGTASGGKSVISYIKSLGYSRIDYLVASHPDADHIGGMAAVIKTFDIGEVWAPKKESNTRTYEYFLDAIAAKGLTIHTALAGKEIFDDGYCVADLLWPTENCSYTDSNDWSAIIQLTCGQVTFLFPGDASSGIIEGACNHHIDVLKVSHHGSVTGTSRSLVQKLSPSYSVISCGLDNSYGFPKQSVLDLLSGSSLYRTDLQGTITATSDGVSVSFDKNPL